MQDVAVSLPIMAHAARIMSMVRACPVVVIAGTTGSGKTTQLPRLLWEAGFAGKGKKICCTLPTRSGAVNAAEFVASSLDPKQADVVGYRIRFDTRVTKATKIVYMTDGVLVKRIHADPLLREFSVVMIDEVHERRIQTDFLLAYLKSVLAIRNDLKVIVSSATMQTEALARYFNNAPIISIPVKQHPVEIVYQPVAHDLHKEVARLVQTIHAKKNDGHTLVFLSGMFDIDRVRHHLRHVKSPNFECMVFHSRVGREGRKKIFAQSKKSKVILATNIAETAVTIPGITHVIDSGLQRESRHEYSKGGYRTLHVKPISQASAMQRAGRAGRTGPGVCYRMYSAESFVARPEFAPPQTECGDITDFVLQLLARGVQHPERLDLPTPLDATRVESAMRNLQQWGAVTADRVVTDFGRRMIQLPLGPQQAYMVLTAADLGFAAEAVEVASILSVDQLGDLDGDTPGSFAGKFNQFRDSRGDAITFLRAFRAYSVRRGDTVWCESQGLNLKLLEDAHLIRTSLLARLRDMGVRCTYGHDLDKVHRALVRCWGGRLLVHDRKGVYRSGELTGIRISDRSAVHGSRPEYLVAFDILNVGVVLASNPLVVPDEMVEDVLALYGDPNAVSACEDDDKKVRVTGTLRIETPHMARTVRVDINCERSPSRALRMVQNNTVVVEEDQVPLHWLRLTAETLEALARVGITTLANCPKTRRGMMKSELADSVRSELLGKFVRLGYVSAQQAEELVESVTDDDDSDQEEDWLVTDFTKSPIKELGISTRAQMRLVGAGVHTIADLLAVDERKFRGMCGKDETVIDEVLLRLGEFNLALQSVKAQNQQAILFNGPDPIEQANVTPEEARAKLGDEDFELFVRYRETADSEVRVASRNRLINKHSGLRYSVAKQQFMNPARRLDAAIDFDDLVQEAVFGVIAAISKFNPLNGYRFSTYCFGWLKQTINRYCAENGAIRFPAHKGEAITRLQAAVMKLIARLGREVTPEEVAKELGITPEELLALNEARRVAMLPVSLDGPASHSSDEETWTSLGEIVADESASAEQQLINISQTQQGKDLFAELINSLELPARHLVMFRARYGLDGEDPKTLEEVGDLFQVTRERVRQIEWKVFEALRQPAAQERVCAIERAFRGDDLADELVAPSPSAVVEERRREMRQIRVKNAVDRVLRDLNVPSIAVTVFKFRHGLNGEAALSATATSTRLGIELGIVNELEQSVASALYDVDVWEQLRHVSPGLPRPEEPIVPLAEVRQTGSVDLLMHDGFVPSKSHASAQEVIEAVALRARLSLEQIMVQTREREVFQARCMVAVVFRDHLHMTFEDIALELRFNHRQNALNAYRAGKRLFGVVTWKFGQSTATQ